MKNKQTSRRNFLMGAGSGFLAPRLAQAPPATGWNAQEKANVELVNKFCAAWSSRDMSQPLSFLAADSIYRMSETKPPAKGHDGVIEKLKSYVDESDRVEFKVFDTFAKGSIVMNHRIDSFVSKTRPVTWEGVGVFFVQNGKIKEWSDYTIRVGR